MRDVRASKRSPPALAVVSGPPKTAASVERNKAAKRARRAAQAATEEAAARLFLAMLQDEAGAGELLWRIVYREYMRFAAEKGLPAMTEMSLAKRLQGLGCQSRLVDLRASQGRRPTVLSWPELSPPAAVRRAA